MKTYKQEHIRFNLGRSGDLVIEPSLEKTLLFRGDRSAVLQNNRSYMSE